MNSNGTWNAGENILLRGVWRKRLWLAAPVTVVQDSPNLIAVYWKANTPSKIPAQRITYKELLSNEQIHLVDSKWVTTDVLMLSTPGSAHGILVMWESGHVKFNCWYVNLQEPLRRTPMGLDTMDQLLDIVIEPDLSSWHWKDEDEFADTINHGVYSLAEAQAIREEGERVIKTMQDANSLLIQGWEKWRPPTDWQIPEFPAKWDDLSFYNDQS